MIREEDPTIQTRVNDTQFIQVIVNLITNAADAIKRFRERWIRISTERDGKKVYIRVIDSGNGVSPALAHKIMSPFFTTKKDGVGLGLALSSSIVAGWGGELRVNQKYENTCFEIALPIDKEKL